MPQIFLRLASCGLVLLLGLIPRAGYATDHFVNVNNFAPSAPYTNWASAAVTIQDAVDTSAPGDVIWVTDGTYSAGGRPASGAVLTSRVVVDKPITIQSVNGPQLTIIQGQKTFSAPIRCIYLTNGAVLSGFTLKNGATTNGDFLPDQSGGGAFCESSSVVISNCVITGNTAIWEGGGVFSGKLYNCTISGNSALEGGGTASSAVNKNKKPRT